MKLITIGHAALFVSWCVLLSCSDDKSPAGQYGTTMVPAYKNTQKFENTLNVQQVQKSIQEYYAANGKYPADLNELATFSGLTLKSDQFEYNPATGALTEKH